MKKNCNVFCGCYCHRWEKLILTMKLTILAFFLGLMSLSASTYSQATRLSLEMKNVSIEEIFRKIEAQSDFVFIYKNDAIDLTKRYDIDVDQSNVEYILNEIFKDSNTKFEINDRQVIITKEKNAQGIQPVKVVTKNDGEQPQEKEISGSITDSQGFPLPGVSIVVKGTTIGTVTDANGKFQFSIPLNAETLIFSFVGMKTQEVAVNDLDYFTVKLEEDIVGLEEVVAVGYGVQKKVNLTGAVAAVKGEELSNRTFSDTRQALQGMASGMTIIDRGGIPGEESLEMTIRGVSSLSASSNPLVLVDGIESSMSDVNPNDIESISVLKDAASSAIYGSRAANGVILITTKRGTEGKVKVFYNGYFGIQSPASLPESVTAEQYLRLVNEALVNGGSEPKYSEEYIQKTVSGTDPINYPFVNQFEELFNNAPVQNHAISMNGGTKIARMALSVNYLDQQGMLENVASKRYGIRLNTDLNITEKLRVHGDFNFIRRDSEQPNKLSSALVTMMNSSPVMVMKYDNGIYGLDQELNSALASLEVSGMNRKQVEDINVKLGADYDIINGLKAGVDFSYKSGSIRGKDNTAEYTFYDHSNPDLILRKWTPSSLTDSRSNSNETNFRGILEYDKKLGEHSFHVLGGTEMTEFTVYDLSASIQNLYSNDYIEINTGDPETISASGAKADWALLSYMGRLNYNFADKYLVEANVRYDGSSKFDTGRKWGFFPSVSAAWRISNEDFMKSFTSISNLKLRGSWGQLGNQNIGNYRFTSSVSSGYTYSFSNSLVSGYSQSLYANTDITWETTEMLDFGLDLTLFNGKIDLVADWYQKNTKDVLLTLPISLMVGLSASETNAGQIRNTGWEFTLTHSNRLNDFYYSVSLNLSDVKNQLYDFAGKDPVVEGWTILKEGEPLYAFYGYKCLGFFQSEEEIANAPVQPNHSILEPGDLKFADLNDDKIIDDADRTVIGSPIPRFSTSLNINLSYKNFDFNAYFQGILKVKNYFYGAVNEGPNLEHFTTTRILDRWTPENTDASFPRLNTSNNTNNTLYSDFWLRDASYVRLKNLQIGYTVPATLVKRANIEKLRFYTGVTNLFTFTSVDPGIDPETYEGRAGSSSFSYPPVSTWTFGIQLDF